MLRVDIGELPLWMELLLLNIAGEKGGGGDGASSKAVREALSSYYQASFTSSQNVFALHVTV
jgi:hypothetical protein